MSTQTLLQHRNGSTWVLLDSLQHAESPSGLASLTEKVAGQTGRPVLGFRNAVSDGWAGGSHLRMFMTGFRTNDANMDAMRAAVRATGDSSPDLQSDDYVSAKFAYLLNARQLHLFEVQGPDDDVQARFLEAVERSYKYLPGEVVARLRQLFTPTSVGIMVATLGIYAAAHFFGVGFIADVVLAGLAVAAIGTVAIDAFLKLVDFYAMVKAARSDAELEAAGKLFADIVLTLGVGATAAILTRRPLAGLERREMNEALARRLSSGGPASTQPLAQKLRGKIGDFGDALAYGPGAMTRGRAINLTDDGAFLVRKAWDDAFFVAAHATRSSTSFFRNVEGTAVLGARSVAVQMWKAGYRGGDVVLIACESGVNRGLVAGLHRELSKLGLDRSVGAIFAPRRAVTGKETLGHEAAWETFSFN